MGGVIKRDGLARQGVIGGGEQLLAEVRARDEINHSVAVAVESGEDPDLARQRIELEVRIGSLVDALGAEVIRVDPDSFGNPV